MKQNELCTGLTPTLGELQRQQERILASVGEGLHGIDQAGKIIFENPAACAMLGWDMRELIGQPAHRVMHHTRADGSPYPAEECPIHATLRDGVIRRVEDEPFWRKDGTSFPVTYTSTPMRNETGEIIGVVVAFRDITERKQLQAQASALARLSDRLSVASDSRVAADAVADITLELFAWDACCLLRYDAASNTATDFIFKDTIKGERVTVPRPPGCFQPTPVLQRVLNEGAQLLLRQEAADCADITLRFGDTSQVSLSLMYVALRLRGQVIGFLSVQSCRPNAYTQKDLETLQSLADHCAGAITRIDAEDALRASEARYALTERAVADGMWDWNILTGEAVFSPRWKEILGYRDDELVNHKSTFQELIHPDDRAAMEEVTRSHLEAGKPYALEFRLRHKDGSYRWVFSRGEAMRDPTGRPVRMFGATTDITARKQAEGALRESEERFRLLWAQSLDGIRVTDAVGIVIMANPAYCRMMGLPPEAVEGQPMSSVYLAENRAKIQADHQKNFISHGVQPRVETQVTLWNGETLWLDVANSYMKQASGEPLLLGLFRNITERKQAAAALEHERTLLRTLIDLMPDFIFIKDTASRFLMANQSLAKSYGRAPEELLGHRDADFMAPELAARCRASELKVLAAEAVCVFEDTFMLPDGQTRTVSTNMVAFRDAQGCVAGLVGIGRDITERKQMEKQAVEKNRFFELLMDSMPNQIFWKDCNLVYQGCNHEFAKAIGLASPDQVVGKTDSDFARSPYFTESSQKTDHQIIASGEPILNFEEEFHDIDGNRRNILTSKIPIKDVKGNALGVLGVCVEITERKQAEEAHRRLATVVEQASESIIITDPQGNITYVNPAFEKTSGYTAGEVIGQTPRLLKSGQRDAEFYRKLWEALLAGHAWSGHFVNRRKDGKLYEEDATISPIRDAAGKVINYVAVKRDITREVQLETQLRQSQKMEAIGQLAGGVAHDFNNILASTLMQVELLKGEPTAAEVQEGIEQIRTDVNRAANLTRQLLLFSRRQVMQPRDLDLNELVSDLIKMLQRIIGEDVKLHLRLHPGELMTRADPGMLDQVLMNLVVNARDAMPHGGELRIETMAKTVTGDDALLHAEATPGQYVCFSVSDNGGGIPPDILPHIFEPFFTTKDAGKGTGLGLATVYGIIKQHHGWIQLLNRPGQGVTFRIFLPVNSTPVRGAGSDTQFLSRRGTETILLVEDEAGLLKLTQKILERFGYRVLNASNGKDALQLWQAHHATIALLLTDMVMPGGLNGQDLARQLQKEKPGLKVVFVSGYSSTIAGQEFRLAADEAFLQKPFQPDQLLKTVRVSLDGRRD